MLLFFLLCAVFHILVCSAAPESTFTDSNFQGRSLRYRQTGNSVCKGSKGIAGYFDIESDRHLFFWHFESQNNPKTAPVILWLNGGPGCSSVSTGMLQELGPCLINGNATKVNPHSWNKHATIIFLDQPVGTGLSYGDGLVYDSVTAAKEMYEFLQMWFKCFDKISNDFYIAGESFGGTWVPRLAERIQKNQYSALSSISQPYNKALVHIPLKGIMLANSGLSQRLQYVGYYEIGCGGEKKLFDKSICEDMELTIPRCESWLTACSKAEYNPILCNTILNECRSHNMFQIFNVGLNPYDFTKPCANISSCYAGETDAVDYLNQKDVQEMLGVSGVQFHSCNNTINNAFMENGELGKPTDQIVGWLLDQGLRVLIFVGKNDWYCNYPGQRRLSNGLVWHGMAAFQSEPLAHWEYNGIVAGSRKSWRNLDYVEIEGAGHMSPKDKPAEVAQILLRWLRIQ